MEKIFETKDSITYRFQCDCINPACAIDLEVDKVGRPLVFFCFYDIVHMMSQRIKWAWRMIRTGEGLVDEFVIREEDISNIISVLKEAMHKEQDKEQDLLLKRRENESG